MIQRYSDKPGFPDLSPTEEYVLHTNHLAAERAAYEKGVNDALDILEGDSASPLSDITALLAATTEEAAREASAREQGRVEGLRLRSEYDSTLRKCLALIDALMPGVKHIALQDYEALNLVPLEVRALLGEERIDGLDLFQEHPND